MALNTARGFALSFVKQKGTKSTECKYNVTLGKNIRVVSAGDGGEVFTGKAVDLNADGSLVVETVDGLRTVYAGDVSIRNNVVPIGT